MGCGLYLYGIFPAPGPQGLALQGLDKQSVQTQVVDEFTFLYSEAKQKRYLASRRNLLGHEKVLEDAMQQGYRTLLPLQFGLVVEDWDAVTEQLIVPHKTRLQALFAQLEGKREVGVKIFWETNAELQLMLEENPELKAKRDSLQGQVLSMDLTIQIGQELERSLEQRKETIINRFREELNDLAFEVVENELLSEASIYNAAYLIPWDAEATFGDRVESLDREFEPRLRIRYNNFTAPFNFAQLDRV